MDPLNSNTATPAQLMIDLGLPYVRGDKPRVNYQPLLAIIADEQVRGKTALDKVAPAAVEQPAVLPTVTDFTRVKSDAPQCQLGVAEPADPLLFSGMKRDYLEREALNQSFGLAGEQFILQFEHWRLIALGQPRLADRVDHVSQSKGDGLGYDVLSLESDGQERSIEVKATTFGRNTPFFVSRSELALSNVAKDQFNLYRLFEFRKAPSPV
nr:DUF3883 domain-containing protein [Rhodoferax sp.]